MSKNIQMDLADNVPRGVRKGDKMMFGNLTQAAVSAATGVLALGMVVGIHAAPADAQQISSGKSATAVEQSSSPVRTEAAAANAPRVMPPADVRTVPRSCSIHECFHELEQKGLWIENIDSPFRRLGAVPIALRFQSVGVRDLLAAVAAQNGLRTHWYLDNSFAVLERGEPDKDIASLAKRLQSERFSVRKAAVARAGYLKDVRTIPVLISAALEDARLRTNKVVELAISEFGWRTALAIDPRAWKLLGNWQLMDDNRLFVQAMAMGLIGKEEVLDAIEKSLHDKRNFRRRGVHRRQFYFTDLDQEARQWRMDVETLGIIGGDRAVRLLQEQALHAADAVSAAALHGLIRAQAERALPFLEEALKPDYGRNQYAVLETIGALGGEQALALLQGILENRNEDPARRGGAAYAIGKTGDERGLVLLEKALKDTDRHVRWRAAKGLRFMAGFNVLPLFAIAVRDADPTVRTVAAEGLGYVGGDAAVAMLTPMTTDKASAEAALLALGSIGNDRALATLAQAAADTNNHQLVGWALERVGTDKAADLLLSMLTPNRQLMDKVQYYWIGDRLVPLVAEALAARAERSRVFHPIQQVMNCSTGKAIPVIAKALSAESPVDWQIAALPVLRYYGADLAVPLLTNLLASATVSKTQAGALTLEIAAELGDERLLPAVTAVITDTNAMLRVRRVAVQALGGFESDAVVPLLERVLRDSSVALRDTAVCVLVEMDNDQARAVLRAHFNKGPAPAL